MKQNNHFAVIMAGGVGSRFWPMSKTAKPKQFLDILGTGETLLQQSFRRMSRLVPSENIYVLTNSNYINLVQEQLPTLNENCILTEPIRKNTAPCVLLAALKIHDRNPKAQLIVSPADHLILKEEVFENTIRLALDFSEKKEALLTLGIQPTRPDTGYGYIKYDKHNTDNVKPILQFMEKPSLSVAREFVDSGQYAWNSGLFVWQTNTILKAFAEHAPKMLKTFQKTIPYFNTKDEQNAINEAFEKCESISIDYAIMEKTDKSYVIKADIAWSDLGTWGSIDEHLPHDAQNNSVIGNDVILYNVNNCIVNMPKEKLVVLQGISDCIVVESEGVLLICKKQNEQEIKQFVEDVKNKKGDQFV